MSVQGVLANVNWTDLVLTADKEGTNVKVDGKNFTDADNQRNKASGEYLAGDVDNHKVIIRSSEYWWKLVVLAGKVGFQVPHVQGGSAKGFHTMELEANKSVTWPTDCGIILFLTLVAGRPQHAPGWACGHSWDEASTSSEKKYSPAIHDDICLLILVYHVLRMSSYVEMLIEKEEGSEEWWQYLSYISILDILGRAMHVDVFWLCLCD
ncbi:hypothetical protein F4604DRAFT_2006132 [Suillus subluteus]|nr:hypothetical protein F4604DRAFT_2006132 [Suillus subluteus]